jgi:hypothetical protein
VVLTVVDLEWILLKIPHAHAASYIAKQGNDSYKIQPRNPQVAGWSVLQSEFYLNRA